MFDNLMVKIIIVLVFFIMVFFIAIRYFYLGMMKRLYFTVSFILEDMRYENKQTNAMRELDKHNIEYEVLTYDHGKDAVAGDVVASMLDEDPEKVFKTLVTGKYQRISCLYAAG